MKKQHFSFLILPLLAWACMPRVAFVSSQQECRYKGNLYALPQTVLFVSVEYSIKTFHAGPYGSYAKKYLGLDQVPLDDYTECRIDNLTLSSRQEADPDGYFVLRGGKRILKKIVPEFCSRGLLIDPAQKDYLPLSVSVLSSPAKGLVFTDLSVKNFYREKTDTLYKIFLQDSVFVRLPVYKHYLQTKTAEEKARETADLIIRLRAQRLALLAPEEVEDFTLQPGTESILKNIDEMEKKYLQLFTGSAHTEKISELFCVVPRFVSATDTVVLHSRLIENDSLLLVMNRGENTPGCLPSGRSSRGLPCRFPSRTGIEIFYRGKLLSQSYVYISQAGKDAFFLR